MIGENGYSEAKSRCDKLWTWIAVLLMFFAAAPAPASIEPVASVTVERSGKIWTAEYQLHEQAPVWIFPKSVLPRATKTSWRMPTVRVLTPGVRLERLGKYDALVSSQGSMPMRLRLSFEPFLGDIEGGYDPALAFTDGSVKRGIIGTYHHLSQHHLPRYCREFDFRYNTRKVSDAERTDLAMIGARGKRLTYRRPLAA